MRRLWYYSTRYRMLRGLNTIYRTLVASHIRGYRHLISPLPNRTAGFTPGRTRRTVLRGVRRRSPAAFSGLALPPRTRYLQHLARNAPLCRCLLLTRLRISSDHDRHTVNVCSFSGCVGSLCPGTRKRCCRILAYAAASFIELLLIFSLSVIRGLMSPSGLGTLVAFWARQEHITHLHHFLPFYYRASDILTLCLSQVVA